MDRSDHDHPSFNFQSNHSSDRWTFMSNMHSYLIDMATSRTGRVLPVLGAESTDGRSASEFLRLCCDGAE